MDDLTLVAVLSISAGIVTALLGLVAYRTLAHKPSISKKEDLGE